MKTPKLLFLINSHIIDTRVSRFHENIILSELVEAYATHFNSLSLLILIVNLRLH